MKCLFKIYITAISLLVNLTVFTQDIHFSQYWATPLNTNPALTGFFENNYKVSATYRNQWFHSQSFSSVNASINANFLRRKFNGSFIGVGINFSQEQEGKGTFQNSVASLSFAYNKKIRSKKIQHHLSLGFNTSYTIRQFNFQEYIYGNMFEKNQNFDPLDVSDYKTNSYMDLGIGVNYLVNLTKTNKIGVGFSVMNLLEQLKDYNTYVNTVSYRKYTFLLNAELGLSKRFVLLPISSFQTQGPHNKLNLGSYLKYGISQKNINAIMVGVQYRLSSYQKRILGSDAVILGVRTILSDFDIGLSYDVTLSKLNKSNTFVGSPEIAISYSFSNMKSKKIICPSF